MKELIFPRLLFPRAERLGDKVGFVDVTNDGVRYEGTFATHVERVLRLSHALRHQLGVGSDEPFGVLAMNSHEFIELYHAALIGGGIICPLNIRLSAAELAYVINDARSSVIFTDPVFAPLIERARTEEGAKVDKVVMIGAKTDDASPPGVIGYEDLLGAGELTAPPEPEEDDPVILMYTGGTTGLPKGALLDQRAEVLNVYHVGLEIGLDEERRFLFQSPMFHAAVVAGVIGIPVSGGTSVTIPLFDPGLVLETIEAQHIDTTMMVPVMMSMLEQHPSFSPKRLRGLRQLIYGAAPISATLLQRWLDMLPDVDFYQGYGMTEAASVLTVLGPSQHRADGAMLTAAGKPVFGVELLITDSVGRPVAEGRAGEVRARGGNLMQGYWRNPEATAKAIVDGWYRTGDVGYVDAEGVLHLTDRLNDMIVTGGENVYSTEVEEALANHPAVADVAVIGVPSDAWGEAVHAIVVLKEDVRATGEQLIDHARQQLASFKVPKSIEFHDGPLPLSGAFKPLKRELRRRYWEGHDRQVG